MFKILMWSYNLHPQNYIGLTNLWQSHFHIVKVKFGQNKTSLRVFKKLFIELDLLWFFRTKHCLVPFLSYSIPLVLKSL